MNETGGDEAAEPVADSAALAKAGKLNDRAFVLAVFGLFVPFFGIIFGPLCIVMSVIARRRAREAGGTVDKNSLVFGVVVTVVWGAIWMLILLPGLLQ